jgi:pimeloyl-ACP methyl ester carboxylesterase
MGKVYSTDGTAIAFDRVGHTGPALILVNGALSNRSDAAGLAAELAPHFTVFTYDRRGRGDSGDTAPYAVEREIEDLHAVMTEAGEPVFVYGHSSGAVLALKTARRLAGSIKKLAVYEPPILVDNSRPPLPGDYLARLTGLVSAGHRSQAVAYFMSEGLLVPAEQLAQMQKAPFWPAIEAMAHTLVYDNTIVADTMSGKPLSKDQWASIRMPTLVMDGGDSPEYMHNGAQALLAALPNAQHHRFPGQGHGAANAVLVPVLVDFLRMEDHK